MALGQNVESLQALASDDRLRLLIEHTPAPIAVFDTQMRYVVESRRWREDYRTGDAPLAGRSHYDVFPEIPERWKEAHRRCLAGARESCPEDRFDRADGSTEWIAWDIHPWRDDQGEIRGIIMFTEVVTERRREREALREALAATRDLVAASPIAMITVDGRMKISTTNMAAERILGLASADLAGRPLPLEPIAEGATLEEMIRKAQGGAPQQGVEFRGRSGAGTEIFLRGSVTRLSNSPSGGDQALVMLEDVTAERRALESFREQAHFTNSLLRAWPDLVYVYDLDEARSVYVNRPAPRGSGRQSTTDAAIEGLDSLIHPDDLAIIQEARRRSERAPDGAVVDIEFRVLSDNGEWRWRRSRETPFRRDADGRVNQVIGVAVDINESKLAEDALRASQERFAAVSRATADTIYDWNFRNGAIWWNDAFRSMFGYGSAESVERFEDWRGLIHPDDLDAVDRALAPIIAGEETNLAIEYRFRHADGRFIDVLDRGHVLTDQAGNPVRMIGSMLDLTERKRVEQCLRESEERYRAVVEQQTELICRLKPDRTLTWVNDAYAKYVGKPAEAMVGRDFLAELPERTRSRLQRQLDSAIAALTVDKPDGTIETWSLDPTGRRHFHVWNGHGVFDETGQLLEVQTVARDITERRQAEMAVKASEERFRALVEDAFDAVAMLDVEGRNLYISPNATRVLGRDLPSAIGDYAFRNVHPDDLASATSAWQQVLGSSNRAVTAVVRVEHADGSWRWIETTARNLLDNPSVGAIVVNFHDVTQRREAEQEQERMERRLQEAQKLESLGVLAGGIAHDFNNILTGILGSVSIAQNELPPSSPTHVHLEQVQGAAQRAADLCRQMLAYSGRGRFVVQRINLSVLVEETIHLLRLTVSKKAALRTELARGLPAVMADATQIRQIIMNLVMNASDAIGDTTGVITLSTRQLHVDKAYLVETVMSPDLPEGAYVCLEVSDTGVGMTPETRGRIFDPFFTTKFTGRGLGLAAALGIVRGHRGAMKVDSELGRGSTFCLLLPAVAGPAESLASTEVDATNWTGSGRVLVADDEPIVRDVTARMLASMGFSVDVVCDGRAAIERFQSDPDSYRLVLLDLTMPRMDGEETFADLRRIRPTVPVILMSGFTEQDAVSRFIGKGLAGFIAKPFRRQELLDRVKEALTSPTR